jgi:hypothetical protein
MMIDNTAAWDEGPRPDDLASTAIIIDGVTTVGDMIEIWAFSDTCTSFGGSSAMHEGRLTLIFVCYAHFELQFGSGS